MRGKGGLQANGSLGLGTSPVADRPELARFPVLELADGQFDVQAGRSLSIEGVLNPTMLPLTLANSPNTLANSFFFTYSDSSALHLFSLLGDVSIQTSSVRLAELTRANTSSKDSINFGSSAESQVLTVLPPTLSAVALSGSVSVEGSASLYPASRGHLDILAAASVTLNGSLIMSDSDPDLIARPWTPANAPDLSLDLITGSPLGPGGHGATRLLHEGDTGVTRIVARGGDIAGVQGAILASATPVRAIAGRDIDNLFLVAQNLSPSDISVVSAGRDIRYELSRNAGTGGLLPNPNHVNIGGPGLLEVMADRDVDLGSSFGLVTRGSLNNPLLPDVGASIRVTAGSRATIDAAAFAVTYLRSNATNYRSELVTFMQTQTGKSGLSQDEAVDAFLHASDDTRRQFASLVSDKEFQRRYLQPTGTPGVVTSYLANWNAFAAEHGFSPNDPPPSQLREFQLGVLWSELRASGRAAVATGATPGNYSRGFAALNALGLDGPYQHSGRLDLIFSQIKTERGGDIDLLVPGGGVDVGLATPPQGFSKGPGSLGIVTVKGGDVSALASGNFQVNQSRVFTLEGGNILILSSRGDIDAGRGAKTAISAPPPVITVNAQGQFVVEFPGAATGSGIGVLLTRPDVPAGDVDLIAPTGTVNAGDAGIRSSGRVTIAATRVIGADNISAAGPVVGVPVAQSNSLGSVSTSSALAEATKSTDQVTGSISDAARASQAEPTSRSSFITVEVIGVGEDEADRRRSQESQ
jgi:filamentous hemagglutinin